MTFPKGDLTNLLFLLLAFGLLWLAYGLGGWLLVRKSGRTVNRLITEQDNLAVGCRLMGLILGLALGLAGVMSYPSRGLTADLAGLASSGLLMLALLLLAWLVNDRLLVRSVDNTSEVLQGNLAVGLVELGSFVASGLILKGAFSGSGTLLSGVAFFALGQVSLVVFFLLMEWLSPYNDQGELAKGNTALGLHLAGMLVSVGLVVAASVAGDFTYWTRDLGEFAYAVGKGMFLLLLLGWLTDRAFLRHTTMAREIAGQRNCAAVLLCLGVKLSLAVIIIFTVI
ncbi:MAG: DUF350 domain-containing protein [Desulfarculus sp.]|nr:DUF350 domain-containing protein [Desulfarculus sp.]